MDDPSIKDVHFLDYWRVVKSRKEIILAVTLLVVVTASAYTFTRPKIFMASAKLEIRQDTLDFEVFGQQSSSIYNPVFLKTQYEVIKSRNVLKKVVENLNLGKIWGERLGAASGELDPESSYKYLFGKLKVKPFRDTALIVIEIYDESPESAADIANAVAQVYRDRRVVAKKNELKRAIDVLSSELNKQQEVLNLAEEELERVRVTLDISMTDPMGRGGLTDSIRLRKLEGDRITASIDMLVRGVRLAEVEALPNDELIHAVPYITRDHTLTSIKNSLIDTEVTLKLRGEQFGPAHPEVRQLQAAVDILKSRITDALEGMKKGLRADYEVARKKFEELDKVLTDVRAQDIKNVGGKYLPFAKAQRNVELQRHFLNALEARITQEGIEIEVPRTPVEIIEAAVPPEPTAPVSPKYLFNIVASILVGLGLGIAMAYFIEYLDTSVKTVDDVEQTLGLPVIGIIPQKVQPLSEEGADSPHAEAYRLLRTNLQFSDKGMSGGAYAILSGGVGEGKSTTLFNLAYVSAQLGDKVLIVDSDLRRPVQHTFLNMSNRFGLTNFLMRDASLEEVIQPTKIPNLHFLPSGMLPRTALGLLESQRIRDLVLNLKARYDYVFFDAPPLMGVSDGSIIASEVDAVLLVVQYRKYPRVMSTRAKRIVENVGGKILGVVLNNINIMRDDYYYYYHTQYSHYGGEDTLPPEEHEAAADAASRDHERKREEQVY